MDYPKSEPGVNLLNGQFTDGNPLLGIPASRDPAKWANDVTEEILNVVREVGDEPDEGQSTQLVGAIWKMFRAATAAATEALRGVLRIGTQSEVDAGVLDSVAVTPKKLRWGFAASFTTNGYLALPTWLGGVVFQWGSQAAGASAIPFVIPFPNSVWYVSCGEVTENTSGYYFGQVVTSNLNGATCVVYGASNTGVAPSAASFPYKWFAIGR